MTSIARLAVALGVCVTVSTACGGGGHRIVVPGGQPSRGPQLIEAYGCGSCHTIGGVQQANGKVGPNLGGLADQRLIAGRLANTPQNLIAWIRNPQAIEPGTVMPNLGVSAVAARDIAAFLYRH